MQKPLTPEEEQLLFERLAADPNVIGEIYDLYAQPVFAFTFKRCGHKELAEDITSLTFVRLLESAPTLEYRGRRLSSWLFQVASNAIIDHYRKSSTKKRSPSSQKTRRPGNRRQTMIRPGTPRISIAGDELMKHFIFLPERTSTSFTSDSTPASNRRNRRPARRVIESCIRPRLSRRRKAFRQRASSAIEVRATHDTPVPNASPPPQIAFAYCRMKKMNTDEHASQLEREIKTPGSVADPVLNTASPTLRPPLKNT